MCHPEYLFLCGNGDVPSTTLLDLCYVELQEVIEPGEKLLSEGWAPLATRVLYERRTCLDSPMVGGVPYVGQRPSEIKQEADSQEGGEPEDLGVMQKREGLLMYGQVGQLFITWVLSSQS